MPKYLEYIQIYKARQHLKGKFKCCRLLIAIKLTTFKKSNTRTLCQMYMFFAHFSWKIMLLTVTRKETILTLWSNLIVLQKKAMILAMSTTAMQTQDLEPQQWRTWANTRELQVLHLLFVRLFIIFWPLINIFTKYCCLRQGNPGKAIRLM